MAKRKELSPEEQATQTQKRIQEKLESELKEIRARFVPKNPTYSFETGEEVFYGNFDKTVILEKLDEGLIYLVEITSKNNTDNKFRVEIFTTDKRYCAWTELRKKGNWREQPVLCDKSADRIQYMQQTIYSLFIKAYHSGVDMNPEYQREHVWTLEDKVELIDSIMNNVDIGKFVFVCRSFEEARGKEYYEILDGKQRLSAILEFYEDRFPYKGKYFSQLHGYDRAHLTTYNVSVAELSNISLEKRIETFIRLNTAGRIMDKSHLEKVKKMLVK